jgi:hypothetical protein
MTATSPGRAFAAATAALVCQDDLHNILTELLADCQRVLSVDAVGVMVSPTDNDLELLGASSHRAVELELFQIQHDKGPCRDCIHSGELITAASAAEILDRWGEVGEAILGAGFSSLQAFPMRWQGRVLGGLNTFRSTYQEGPDDLSVGQAFADMMTLLLVRSTGLSDQDLAARINEAIAGRAVIERAKGVLAYRLGVDMGDSYRRLLEHALANDLSVSAAAEQVVRDAHL